MGMIMNAAGTIVNEMGRNDQCYSKGEQPILVLMPDLFAYQEQNAESKEYQGPPAMVMFFITMNKRIHAYGKGQNDHKVFKMFIIYDIYAENGQTC